MRKFPQIKKLASWVTVLSSYSIWLRRDINLNGQSWQCRWPLKRPSRKYWRRIYFGFLILKSLSMFSCYCSPFHCSVFINTIVAIIMIIINFTTNIIIVLNVIISRFPVLVDAGSDAVHFNRGDLIFPPSRQLDDFNIIIFIIFFIIIFIVFSLSSFHLAGN